MCQYLGLIDHSNSWCNIISERPRHRQTRNVLLLNPNSKRTNLLSIFICIWKNPPTVHLNSDCLSFIISFVVSRKFFKSPWLICRTWFGINNSSTISQIRAVKNVLFDIEQACCGSWKHDVDFGLKEVFGCFLEGFLETEFHCVFFAFSVFQKVKLDIFGQNLFYEFGNIVPVDSMPIANAENLDSMGQSLVDNIDILVYFDILPVRTCLCSHWNGQFALAQMFRRILSFSAIRTQIIFYFVEKWQTWITELRLSSFFR